MSTSMFITYEPTAGCHLDRACRESVEIANRRGVPVAFRFNDVDVVADPGELPEAVADRWQAENDRQAEAWRNSPEGRAAAAEFEDRLRRSQQKTGDLIARLPGIVNDLGALVRWCVELSDAADHVGVKWSTAAVIRTIEAAGYVANAHVGRPPGDFADRQVAGEYIVGQAIACMRKGLPPHPVIDKFAREGGFIS